MTFGQRLVEIRVERNLMPPEAARAAKTVPDQWRKWEGDIQKPKLDTLEAITRGLRLTPDELFYLVTGIRPRTEVT